MFFMVETARKLDSVSFETYLGRIYITQRKQLMYISRTFYDIEDFA